MMNNPKTTWTGVSAAIVSTLTILAALPFESGSTLAGIIPQAWKPYIIVVGIFATLVLRIWNAAVSKDQT